MFNHNTDVEKLVHEKTDHGNTQYVILDFEGSDRLQRAVNMAIEKWGYVPIGGVSHVNTSICIKSYQAIYKYSEGV